MSRATISLSLSLLALAACGSGTTSTSGAGGAGTGGGAPRAPKVHRVVGATCTGERAVGSTGFMQPGDKCKADADCTAGTNGRCVAALGQSTFCSYDACSADADCGAVTVCECRDPASYHANTCVHGTCRVDADCGAGGFCSPSAVTINPDCSSGISASSVGYFCHQPGDACVDDADCSPAMADGACIFSVDAMHWVCHHLACTG